MRVAKMLGVIVLFSLLIIEPPVKAQQPVPIIDLHFHPQQEWDIRALVGLFDQLGVARAANGPKGPDGIAVSFAARYPDRFIPFVGQGEIGSQVRQDGDRAWGLGSQRITAYLGQLEDYLQSGIAKGIGELFPNNLHSHSPGLPGTRYPVDSPLMRRLWALSAQYGVPLSVHLEADGASVAEMERLLDVTPQGIFIWAHTGFFAESPLLRRLLQQHPDLFCELSWRDYRAAKWTFAIPISGGNQLKSTWKDLLEEFPDRFVIGTDVATASIIDYASLINYWRAILSELKPDTAAKLAHLNAERILKLPPSSK